MEYAKLDGPQSLCAGCVRLVPVLTTNNYYMNLFVTVILIFNLSKFAKKLLKKQKRKRTELVKLYCVLRALHADAR